MNPQWNTPPNGDFASYVERLSAQASLPKRQEADGEHGLDIGMTPSAEPHNAMSDAAEALRRRLQSNGEAQPAQRASAPGAGMLKAVGFAWLAVLAAMLVAGLPFGMVIGVFVLGVWLATRFRHLLLPQGMGWKQYLESAARAQPKWTPNK